MGVPPYLCDRKGDNNPTCKQSDLVAVSNAAQPHSLLTDQLKRSQSPANLTPVMIASVKALLNDNNVNDYIYLYNTAVYINTLLAYPKLFTVN